MTHGGVPSYAEVPAAANHPHLLPRHSRLSNLLVPHEAPQGTRPNFLLLMRETWQDWLPRIFLTKISRCKEHRNLQKCHLILKIHATGILHIISFIKKYALKLKHPFDVERNFEKRGSLCYQPKQGIIIRDHHLRKHPHEAPNPWIFGSRIAKNRGFSRHHFFAAFRRLSGKAHGHAAGLRTRRAHHNALGT